MTANVLCAGMRTYISGSTGMTRAAVEWALLSSTRLLIGTYGSSFTEESSLRDMVSCTGTCAIEWWTLAWCQHAFLLGEGWLGKAHALSTVGLLGQAPHAVQMQPVAY